MAMVGSPTGDSRETGGIRSERNLHTGLFARGFNITGVIVTIAFVAAVAGTAFLGIQVNQSQAALRASNARLHSTQTQLDATSQQLKTAQGDLTSMTEAQAGQRQIDEYASTFIAGSLDIDQAAIKADTACNGKDAGACKPAMANWLAQVNAVKAELTNMPVRPEVADADREVTEGLDLMATSATKMQQAFDLKSQSTAEESGALAQQAWTHLNRAESMILQVLSAPGSQA